MYVTWGMIGAESQLPYYYHTTGFPEVTSYNMV